MAAFVFQSTAIKYARFYFFYCNSGPDPHPPPPESTYLFLSKNKAILSSCKKASWKLVSRLNCCKKRNSKLPGVTTFYFVQSLFLSKEENILVNRSFLPQASQVPNLGTECSYNFKLLYIKMIISSTASFPPKSHLKDTHYKEPKHRSFIVSKFRCVLYRQVPTAGMFMPFTKKHINVII